MTGGRSDIFVFLTEAFPFPSEHKGARTLFTGTELQGIYAGSQRTQEDIQIVELSPQWS